MTAILAEVAELAAARRPFVLATVVWRRAPSSGQPGGKAIVLPDGPECTVHGWVGGACAQPTLIRQAREALDEGRPRLVFLGPADEFDGALRDGVVRVPMACESEGALEIYLEPVLPPPHVCVVGESALVATLAALVRDLGWTASVVDDAAAIGPADGATAIVVATQGRYDESAVAAALATSAGYVGLVASAKRAAAVREVLRASGPASRADAEQVARLRAPAGLDLGAVHHEEIAVAVLAELVALRAAGGFRVRVDAAPGSAEAVDPVCAMAVTVAGARHVSRWAGREVYFCAASCKRAFDADPAKYASALADLVERGH